MNEGGHREQVSTSTPFCSPTHAFTPSPTPSACPSCREGRRQAPTWVGSERARLLSGWALIPVTAQSLSPLPWCPEASAGLDGFQGSSVSAGIHQAVLSEGTSGHGRGCREEEAPTRPTPGSPIHGAVWPPSISTSEVLARLSACLSVCHTVRLAYGAHESGFQSRPPGLPASSPRGSVLSGTLSGTALPTCVNWPS